MVRIAAGSDGGAVSEVGGLVAVAGWATAWRRGGRVQRNGARPAAGHKRNLERLALPKQVKHFHIFLLTEWLSVCVCEVL